MVLTVFNRVHWDTDCYDLVLYKSYLFQLNQTSPTTKGLKLHQCSTHSVCTYCSGWPFALLWFTQQDTFESLRYKHIYSQWMDDIFHPKHGHKLEFTFHAAWMTFKRILWDQLILCLASQCKQSEAYVSYWFLDTWNHQWFGILVVDIKYLSFRSMNKFCVRKHAIVPSVFVKC